MVEKHPLDSCQLRAFGSGKNFSFLLKKVVCLMSCIFITSIGCTEAHIGCTDVPIGCTEAPIGCFEAPIGCTEAPRRDSWFPRFLSANWASRLG